MIFFCEVKGEGRPEEINVLAAGEIPGRPVSEVFSNASLFADSRNRARAGTENIFQFALQGETFEVFYSPSRDDEHVKT